jgi:GT2 family glycosyltransferase
MFVSIIVCTHSLDDFQNLTEAVDSLLNQTYKEIEIIIVVDGNQELYEKIVKVHKTHGNIKIMVTEESLGAFGAGNVGIEAAQGDVVAFLDDDAVAEGGWVKKLVETYQQVDAIAVGGKILPIWLSNKPDYFPEELGWLVGMTQDGFANGKVAEVRNTWGSNMSFRREVFKKIGLLNPELGLANRRTSFMQGAEAEFALRMKNKLGKGIIYNPEAVVYHKIPASRTKRGTLLRRSFYQGYSKALLRRLNPSPEALATEKSYLKDLLLKYIPRRIKGIVSSNAVKEIKQLSFLSAAIISVGLGYMFGYVKR